jgi:hypothetical protein
MTTTTSRPATRGESCTNCGDPETTYCLDSTPTVDQWAAARATVPPPMITLLSRVLLRARAVPPHGPWPPVLLAKQSVGLLRTDLATGGRNMASSGLALMPCSYTWLSAFGLDRS